MVKQTPQQNVSTQERQSEYRDTHTVKKRVQNGGRNGVFSDGPMGATAPDGFGRKNPVHSWGAHPHPPFLPNGLTHPPFFSRKCRREKKTQLPARRCLWEASLCQPRLGEFRLGTQPPLMCRVCSHAACSASGSAQRSHHLERLSGVCAPVLVRVGLVLTSTKPDHPCASHHPFALRAILFRLDI